VRESLDYVTVPGTIAAYYPDATAAFVLSSSLSYIVDPRTPLFQEHIPSPRASHHALATWLGERVERQMGDADNPTSVSFPRSFYTDAVLEELVLSCVQAQVNYGGRADEIQAKLDRYQQLLNEALAGAGAPASVTSMSKVARPPSFVLLPYFAASSTRDPWWDANMRIWQVNAKLPDPGASAVISIGSPFLLGDAIRALPAGLSEVAFFWVTGMDERKASESELLALAESVASTSSQRRLVNLYGGFLSISLAYIGLWGFNNGLGYSESRSWPELSATGAAPARYYVRPLHAFVAPAAAQLLAETDSSFSCDCSTCANRRIAALTYHDLKRHFALSRRWEIELVQNSPPGDLADSLDETAQRVETDLAPALPSRLVPDVRHLRTWAAVLRQLQASQQELSPS
jgi:hypothetical protein